VFPVANLVATLFDRLLFRDAYSRYEAVHELVTAVGNAPDARAATALALATVRGWLNLTWLAVLLQQDGRWTIGALAETNQGAAVPLAAMLATVEPTGSGPAVSPSAAETFPVYLGIGERAVLLVGAKANGEALRRQDHDVLNTLATLLGAPLARAQLLLVLQERVRELERRKATLHALSRRLLTAQERERQRLAGDLHDGPLQHQHHLLRRLEARAPGEECHTLATRVAAELRTVCVALRPPALEQAGLAGALQSLARAVEPMAGCPITVQDEAYVRGRLSSEAELALYRIAQEALQNCARHSGASAVTATLQSDDAGAVLSIRDNGMGFVPDDGAADGPCEARVHLGLIQMQECARTQGGCCVVTSMPDGGTIVRAVLPGTRTEGLGTCHGET
jgi:signal transduction histidine kinase